MIIDFNSIRNNLINNKKIKYCKKSGNTLLHILIIEGDLEGFKNYSCILKEFINNRKLINKIINKQNFNGDTPAHVAVRKSKKQNNIYSAMVEILQELGANFSISNNNNEVITKLDDGDKYNEKIKKYIKKCLFNENNNSETFTISIIPENVTDIKSVNVTDIKSVNAADARFVNAADARSVNSADAKADKRSVNAVDAKSVNAADFKPIFNKPVNNKERFEIFTNYNNYNNNEIVNYSSTSPYNLNGGNRLYSDTENSLNNIDKLSSSPNINYNLNGGAKYSEYSESTESSNSNSNSMIYGKRHINNPYIKGGSRKAQKIHNDIIEHIIKLGYNEQEAKDIKNVLYYEVKDKYPSLTNTEKAEKMLELVDKKVKNIDMKDIHKILEEKRGNRNKDTKEPTETKETKETKKTKKTSKKTSKRVQKNKK
jgi:hypothetical protein